MMKFLKSLILIPLSWIYGCIVGIRHTLFDWKIIKSREFDIPIVCIGNLTVGGTGKTPHTEYLVRILSHRYNVAVLSRGYKRKTRGFYLATTTTSFKRIGDEPKQIKLKFPDIPVAVCEKRSLGIDMIRQAHPEVNLIILDDAFQHRYVEPWLNILLTDYNNPIYEDRMLPWGRLRDKRNQIHRAQIVITTKCPENMRPLDCRIVSKNLDLAAYQTLYFTRFRSDHPVSLFPTLNHPTLQQGQNVIVMTGIANPTNFICHVQSLFKVIHKLIFPDHYAYKMNDIYKLEELLKSEPKNTAIIITEKDAVKLMNSRKISENIRRRLHYISISVEFADSKEEEFIHQLEKYVSENQKYNITHPL